MDVNILAAATPAQVREPARFLLEICGSRGRYALGSGNSIPSYVPPENYLAMLDEAFEVCLNLRRESAKAGGVAEAHK